MLVLTTTGRLDLHGELMKGAVELFDIVGLFFIITQNIGKGDLKILIAGVGTFVYFTLIYYRISTIVPTQVDKSAR